MRAPEPGLHRRVAGGENVKHIGEYLEIVRPRRLVFTLSVEKYSLDFELMTVVFDPRGTGCELSLG
jgi:uncharacterized protein YndB with AHSA1/START domain